MILNLDFKNKNAEKEAAAREKNAKMMKKLAKTASYDAATLFAVYSSSEHGMTRKMWKIPATNTERTRSTAEKRCPSSNGSGIPLSILSPWC